MTLRTRSGLVVLMLTAGLVDARAQSTNVDRAILFLRNACVTSGSATSIEITTTRNGALEIRNVGDSTTPAESVTVNRKELEGLADSASAVAAQQASEMRGCMNPHIDKIVTALLSPGTVQGANAVTVETSGEVFVTAEFDTVIAAIAGRPTYLWPFEALAKGIKLHPAKVHHYLSVGARNKMIEPVNKHPTITNYDCPCFRILDRGVSYIVSRGLPN